MSRLTATAAAALAAALVIGGQVVVARDADGSVAEIVATTSPTTGADRSVTLPADTARSIARRDSAARHRASRRALTAGPAALAVYDPAVLHLPDPGGPRPVRVDPKPVTATCSEPGFERGRRAEGPIRWSASPATPLAHCAAMGRRRPLRTSHPRRPHDRSHQAADLGGVLDIGVDAEGGSPAHDADPGDGPAGAHLPGGHSHPAHGHLAAASDATPAD